MEWKIDSFSMEESIQSDISLERRNLENEFFRGRMKGGGKPERGFLLSLARTGELGTGKRLVIEWMKEFPDDEESIENLVLIESYLEPETINSHWLSYLERFFPRNQLGIAFEKMIHSKKKKNWGDLLKGSEAVLQYDKENRIALGNMALSYFHLGDRNNSVCYWKKIDSVYLIPTNESHLYCRTLYNMKMFEDAVTIAEQIGRGILIDIKIAEIGLRSLYNLGRDRECISQCKIILKEEGRNVIALRHLSRALIRNNRISESISVLKRWCNSSPKSVDGWSSLIEANLMLENEDESRAIRDELLRRDKDDKEYLVFMIEILLRFQWNNEYEALINRKRKNIEGIEEEIAEINMKFGNFTGAWKILLDGGINPRESGLGGIFDKVLTETNTDYSEIEIAINECRTIWTTELVLKKILSNMPRVEVRNRRKYDCLLVSSSLDRGGAERQVALTLRNMDKDRRFDCSLVVHRLASINGRGTYFDELGEISVKLTSLEDRRSKNHTSTTRKIIDENFSLLEMMDKRLLTKTIDLISYFSEEKPDLVHAWQDETILTSAIASALTGVPILLGSARSLSPREKTKLHQYKRPYLRNCFVRIFQFRRFNLSTNSKAGKKSYATWLGMEEDEIKVIPNGINFLEMEKNIQKKTIERILHGYGIGEKDPIIGGVFRLETGKRPKLWIRSFIRARKDIPNLKGLIIGGGRLEEEIMKMISSEGLEDSIFLVGESDSVGSWLKKMDIFLLTSSSEGMPNVLIEAQGFGVPVISTDVGGVSEVVLDGETGILVKSDSSEEIGSIVVKLFSHGERFQMGERAKILSRNRNSIHKMIQTTGETYSRLLSVERGNDERDGFGK